MDVYAKGFVYDALVKNKNDFVGKVAYSLYKADKIAFIKKQQGFGKTEAALDAELKQWRAGKCVNTEMDNYKELAKKLVNDFFEEYAKETKRNLEKIAAENERKEKNLTKREKAIINAKERGFWYGVVQSAVGSLCLSLLIVLAVCINKFDNFESFINAISPLLK